VPVTAPAPVRAAEHPPPLPTLRGEWLSGAVLARSGPFAAGVATAVGLLAAVLVPFGLWRPWLVWPLLLVVLAGVGYLVRHVPAAPAPRWASVASVAVAAGHVAWAAATHAEHVILRRDAGSYALYTQWIATRHGLPVNADLDAFGGAAALADPAFRLASPAFFQVVHGNAVDIVPQFLLGAPAVYSLGWWAGGWTGLFIAPAIVSGLALLGVAGLVTRLCGARWAAIVTLTLGLTQPVLHAARSTYSEPLALLFLAAAMALLVDAVRVGDSRTALGAVDSGHLAAAAGLAFGLAGLVRVDAVREVSLLLPFAAVLALRRHVAARPLVIGALVGTVVSAVPALVLSRPYLGEVAASLVPLLVGGAVLGVASLGVVLVARRRGDGRPATPRNLRRWPTAAGGLVLLTGVVLASRPLWLVARQSAADPGSRVVAGLQRRQGLPVDGGRTYAEHTLTWMSWYTGWIMIAAAWLLLAALAVRSTRWFLESRGRSGGAPDIPRWAGPAAIGLAATVLTLYRPGITPDHPWADRRFVPLVLPTIVIAAGAAVAVAVRFARRRWPASLLVVVILTAVVVMLVPPALATAPVASESTERGEPAAVRRVCDQLEPGDVVLAVDSRGANEWPQVVRGVCGVPAASIKVAADPAQDPAPALAAIDRISRRIATTDHRTVLLAATAAGAQLLDDLDLRPEPVVDVDTTEDQRYLTRAPDGVTPLAVQVWIGTMP
jgi:hypothetical protein